MSFDVLNKAYKYFPHPISIKFLLGRNYYLMLQIIIKQKKTTWVSIRNLLERCHILKQILNAERKFYQVHYGLAKVSLSHQWGAFTQGIQTFWLLKAYSHAGSSVPPSFCLPPQKTLGWAASWTFTLTDAAQLSWALSVRLWGHQGEPDVSLRATPSEKGVQTDKHMVPS